MQPALMIRNKVTGKEFPKGFFNDVMQASCEKDTDTFEITYEDGISEEKKETYTTESLKQFSMKALRDIYNALADGVENPPQPTTSVDGITKAILKLQGMKGA